MVIGYMVIRNDALSLFRISFDADNRPHLSAVAESIDDSPQQIQLKSNLILFSWW
jgi:cell division protein ZapA (FtsZ GTPase activity inhibitor)